MSDLTCTSCETIKPEIAFPQRKGRRVGRVCLACLAGKLRHRVRPTQSKRLKAMEAARHWHCEACGKSYPDVYPNNWGSAVGIVQTLDPLCRGCANRARARRVA